MTLSEALDRLAEKTPDEVVTLIKDMGIEGMPNHPFFCPVAKLLGTMTGERIAVTSGSARNPDLVWVPLPLSVKRTVSQIDAKGL